MSIRVQKSQKIAGAVVGAAVGDALGVPYENEPETGALVAEGPVTEFVGWHRNQPGTYAGDTELFVVQASAIIAQPERWQQETMERLCRWVEQGGTLAHTTAMAVVRVRSGEPWYAAGITEGPQGVAGVVRGAAAALAAVDDPRRAAEAAAEACSLTHKWPPSLGGARLLGHALSTLINCDDCHPFDAVADALSVYGEGVMGERARLALALVDSATSDADAVAALGRGNWITECLPSAIYFAAKYGGDFPRTISYCVWRCAGGDTDSIAFLAGLMAGAAAGLAGIPSPWLNGLRRRELLQRCALRLHTLPLPLPLRSNAVD